MYTLFPYTTLFRSRIEFRALERTWSPSGSIAKFVNSRSRMQVKGQGAEVDRKSTRLNSSHRCIHSFPTRRSSDLESNFARLNGPGHPQEVSPNSSTRDHECK